MKKLILFCAAFMAISFANAQSDKEEIDLMQAAFGMEKKAIVEEFVKVDAAQKDAFWKIYDEYETERKDLAKKRIELLRKYADNYSKLTNEFADSWTKEIISLGKSTDGLIITYYNKVKKATNPIVALQFYQVEGYILSGLRTAILGEVPFPGQQ